MEKMSREDYSDCAIISEAIFNELIVSGIAKKDAHYECHGNVTTWNDDLHNAVINAAEEIAELCNSNQ